MKKHPEIVRVEPDWKRIKILMDEEKKEYTSAEFMLKLPNEPAQSRADRSQSFITGFINPTTAIVRAKGDSIYKKEIKRTGLTDTQEAFSEKADSSGQTFEEIMQAEVSPSLSGYGTVFAVLDKPAIQAESKDEELKSGTPYITVLDPFQVIDFEWNASGGLDWFAYFVDTPVDRTDPFKPVKRWKSDKGIAIWTKTEFKVKSNDGKSDLQPPVPNPFGFVPVVIQAQNVDPNKTIGRSTYFAGSNYLIMGNNLSAAANQEVFKNASATLLMNIQDYGDDIGGTAPTHEKDPDTNLRRLKKQASDVPNVLLYQNKDDKPDYLSRDLDLIELADKRAEKYFEAVLDNEKSTLSPESLKQPQSGVSKGYDFKDVNNTLCSFGNALNHFENQTFRMVALMAGEDVKSFSVAYPDDYDTRDFLERLAAIEGLIKVNYPSKTGMDESYKSLTNEITKSPEKREVIDKEIDAAIVKPEPQPKEAV